MSRKRYSPEQTIDLLHRLRWSLIRVGHGGCVLPARYQRGALLLRPEITAGPVPRRFPKAGQLVVDGTDCRTSYGAEGETIQEAYKAAEKRHPIAEKKVSEQRQMRPNDTLPSLRDVAVRQHQPVRHNEDDQAER